MKNASSDARRPPESLVVLSGKQQSETQSTWLTNEGRDKHLPIKQGGTNRRDQKQNMATGKRDSTGERIPNSFFLNGEMQV